MCLLLLYIVFDLFALMSLKWRTPNLICSTLNSNDSSYKAKVSIISIQKERYFQIVKTKNCHIGFFPMGVTLFFKDKQFKYTCGDILHGKIEVSIFKNPYISEVYEVLLSQ